MALRAFQANPSIGGFGGESLFGGLEAPTPSQFESSRSKNQGERSNTSVRNGVDAASRIARPLLPQTNNIDLAKTKNSAGQFGAGSCDAFAQIVKELVDNAVDACACAVNKHSGSHENAERGETTKRVRVAITSTEVPLRLNTNDRDPGTSVAKKTEPMDCLRIDISDNGCGMENIDECVNAFRSNKNGAMKKSVEKAEEVTKQSNSKRNEQPKQQNASKGSENYTSGRYGVGLTLCLLHAQRLCPGTGACITSATASAKEWTRATYEPDTDADNIVCKKKETFLKDIEGECGTTISLLVPGGEDAQRAWPRLAEYFARFQLSIDLPCSLEVKAPSLQSRPLYVRPPVEMERRIRRKRNVPVTTDASMSDAGASNDSNRPSTKVNWEGGDGFDEGNSPEADRNHQEPKTSKAAQQRAEAELQKKKKICLICKAASAYKSRPDLKVENVAYTTQPIRRNSGSGQPGTPKNGPVLEIGFIVFGPEPDADHDSDGSEHESYHQKQNNNRRNGTSSAKLQVVRMVNGIPLLDSSEALACGVVQKVTSTADTWNSFGLTVLQNNEIGLNSSRLDERNTPTFDINDSAQVAPLLKSTTHSLFQGRQSEDFGQLSSDDDNFDMENARGKRKKDRRVRSILPAHQRLGGVLMVVQIQAKPSALPLPTLSKGRLPLNDKGISDALENGISDCLRSLQKSSPGLLLTAHQLKRVERDVKYVSSVAGAITSVLCRSGQRCVSDKVMNIASRWDDEVKAMGVLCSGDGPEIAQRIGRGRSIVVERSDDHMNIQADEGKFRVDALRSMMGRRLRFVISDELRDAKKLDEKEKQRKERAKRSAATKRSKKSKAIQSDGMKSDCFESERDDSTGRSNAVESERVIKPVEPSRDDFHSDASSPIVQTRRRRCREDSISSREQPSRYRTDSDWSSPERQPSQRRVKGSSIASGFDFDGDISSPIRYPRRSHVEGSCIGSKPPTTRSSQEDPKKPSHEDFDSDTSSPVVQSCLERWKQNPGGSHDDPRRDISTGKASSSPAVHIKHRHWRGKPGLGFDDGYESSPRPSVGRSVEERSVSKSESCSDVRFHSDGSRASSDNPNNSERQIRGEYESSPRRYIGRLDDKRSASNISGPRDGGFQSDGSGPSRSQPKHDDAMSSDSEWSAQFGEGCRVIYSVENSLRTKNFGNGSIFR